MRKETVPIIKGFSLFRFWAVMERSVPLPNEILLHHIFNWEVTSSSSVVFTTASIIHETEQLHILAKWLSSWLTVAKSNFEKGSSRHKTFLNAEMGWYFTGQILNYILDKYLFSPIHGWDATCRSRTCFYYFLNAYHFFNVYFSTMILVAKTVWVSLRFSLKRNFVLALAIPYNSEREYTRILSKIFLHMLSFLIILSRYWWEKSRKKIPERAYIV